MLIKKICMVATEQINNFKSHRQEFGFEFALKTLVYSSIWRAFDIKSSLYINNNLKKLKEEFQPLIDKYNNESNSSEIESETKIIWVCWWQGLNSMPAFCRLCYNRIVKNAPSDYQVILITRNNYKEYVNLPEQIVAKYDNAIIKIQQFSDILRQALLWQVGGIWMDITLYTLPGYVDNIDTSKEFWSVNLGRVVKRRSIGQLLTNCQWSSFIQVGRRNNIVNKFVYEAMCDYYTRHTYTIDYFLQNYLLRTAKENIFVASKIFEDIKVTNSHLYDLSLCINDSYDQEKWDEMCHDTGFFKLTYKVLYKEHNGNSSTFYPHIINI